MMRNQCDYGGGLNAVMRWFLLLTDAAEWRLGHYGNTFAFDMPAYCVLTGMQRRLRDNYGVRGMTWELE